MAVNLELEFVHSSSSVTQMTDSLIHSMFHGKRAGYDEKLRHKATSDPRPEALLTDGAASPRGAHTRNSQFVWESRSSSYQ